MELVYKPQGEKYGFCLFGAKFGDAWGKLQRETLFIYFSDFEYIIESVKSVYPLTDPDTGEVSEAFDITGMNWIHNEAWNIIIKDLQSKTYENCELKNFIDSFCSWILEEQKNSDEIMIEGTI